MFEGSPVVSWFPYQIPNMYDSTERWLPVTERAFFASEPWYKCNPGASLNGTIYDYSLWYLFRVWSSAVSRDRHIRQMRFQEEELMTRAMISWTIARQEFQF